MCLKEMTKQHYLLFVQAQVHSLAVASLISLVFFDTRTHTFNTKVQAGNTGPDIASAGNLSRLEMTGNQAAEPE